MTDTIDTIENIDKKEMKKTILWVLGSSLLLLFASCDKIEKDQYWIYAGANGTWYDTHEDIPAVQNAFVEKYTGVRCVNCPQADVVLHAALEKYGDRLSVVAIHSGVFGKPYGSDEDLRTVDGTVWYDYFGISAQPAAMLMRAKNGSAWDIFTPTSNFDGMIDAVLNTAPTVALKAVSGKEDNGLYSLDIYVGFEADVADTLTVTALIMEDKIYTTQESASKSKIENYEQNHVLRKTITDPWGIDIDALGIEGEKRTVRLDYELDNGWNPENCTVVVFVSNKDTRKILNVTRTPLTIASE